VFNPNRIPGNGIVTGNLGADLRRSLGEAIRRSRKTHAEIAHEMTERLGQPVTQTMLNEFTRSGDREGREVRFPAAWVPAFCEVVGDDALQRGLMSERLRELVSLGERVFNLRSILKEVCDGVAKLEGRERQKKGQGKRIRKA